MENERAGTPRWVKIFALVAIILIAVVAVMLMAGGGEHGPGRHAFSASAHASVGP